MKKRFLFAITALLAAGLIAQLRPAEAAESQARFSTFIRHENHDKWPLRITKQADGEAWDQVCQSNRTSFDYNDYATFSDFRHEVTSTGGKRQMILQWEFENWTNPGVPPAGIEIGIWDSAQGAWVPLDPASYSIADANSKFTIEGNLPNILQTAAQINSVKVAFWCYTNTSDYVAIRVDQLSLSLTNVTREPRLIESTNSSALQFSDDIYFAPYEIKNNTGAYLEDDWMEYSNFNFFLPVGSELGALQIGIEHHENRDNMQEMKLEIWDKSAQEWHNEIIGPSTLTDMFNVIDASSYITAEELNDSATFKMRLLGLPTGAASFLIYVDSFIFNAIRKAVSSDIDIFGPSGTVVPSETGRMALDFQLPDNDGAADTLNALYIYNKGTATTSDIQKIYLYADAGGTGWQGVGTDRLVGEMTWNAAQSRWEISGISENIAIGGSRFFIVADMKSGATDSRTIQLGIPQNGMTVASGFGGPTDGPVYNASWLTIQGGGANQIVNNGAPAATLYANDANKLVMDFTIAQNGELTDTLTGLRIQNLVGTAENSTDISAMQAWAESGALAGFQSAQDTLLGTLSWVSGCSCYQNTTFSKSIVGTQRLYITVNIPAQPTDGRIIQANIKKGSSDTDAGIIVASNNDGPWDSVVTNPYVQRIDGLVASQISKTTVSAANVLPNDTNKLALNFVVPRNGATNDTLNALRVKNTGTAVASTDIQAVKFWKDGGNGSFDSGGGDDTLLGSGTWSSGSSWWELSGQSVALGASGVRIYATVDIASAATQDATIILSLPADSASTNAGVQNASANDGPIDVAVTNPNALTIRSKLTVALTDKAPISVDPGQTDVVFASTSFTATGGAVTLNTLSLTRTGSGSDSDAAVGSVRIYADLNGDGLLDGGDTLLSTAQTLSGGAVSFSGIGRLINAGSPLKVLIVASIAAGATVSNTVGFQIASTAAVGAAPSGTNISGTFPMASSASVIGKTVTLSGMDKAPLQVTPGQTNVLMEKIQVSVSAGSSTISALKIDLSGSGSSADIAAGGARIYYDNDGNGQYDGTEPQLSTSQTFSGGSVTFTGVNMSVTSGSPKSILVVYDIASGATGGNTVGVSVPSSTYVTTQAGTENRVISGAIQSGNAFIGATLYVTDDDLAPASVSVGQSNVAYLRLILSSTSGTLTVTNLKVDRLGTAQDSDTAAGSIKLYRDAGPKDGIFQTSDTLLGSGSFSGGTLTFSLSSNNAVTAGTDESWFVVLNISPSAVQGRTIGAQLANASYVTVASGSVSPDGFAIVSSLSTIGSVLTATGSNLAASMLNVTKGQTGAALEAINFSIDAGSLTLNSLKVDRIGTAVDADTTSGGVRLYKDSNGNGAYDAGDAQVDGSQTFTGGTVTFSGISQTISSGSPVRFFVVVDINSAATQGHTIGVEATDSSYIGTTPSSGVTVTVTSAPIQSSMLTIMNPASLTATFTAPASAISVNTNQTFTVTLRVTNASGSSAASGVAPNPADFTRLVQSGSPTVTRVSGPSPSSASIGGGLSQNFVYTYRADSAGTLKLQGGALGTESNLATSVSASAVQTALITINAQVNALWTFSDGGQAQPWLAPGVPEPDCPVSAPVNTVFIGNRNGNLYALNSPSGTKRWSYSVGAEILSPPSVDYDVCMIFIGDEGGKVTAVQDNGNSGTLVWTNSFGGAIRGQPVLTDYLLNATTYEKRLYFGSTNGKVFCRKAADGSICTDWTDQTLGSPISTTVATTPDLAIWVPTEGGVISKLNQRTGAILVNYTGYGKITAPPFNFPQDIMNYNSGLWMFVGDWNNKFYRINTWATPGSEKAWTFSPTSPVAAQAFEVEGWFNYGFEVNGNLALYVVNNNGCIYSINHLTGVQRWKYPDGGNCFANPIRTAPIYYNDVIYFGNDSGDYYAIRDKTTYAEAVTGWPFATTSGFTAAAGIDIDVNLVVVGNNNSKLYAFPLQ